MVWSIAVIIIGYFRMQSPQPTRHNRRKVTLNIADNNDSASPRPQQEHQLYIKPVYSTRNLLKHHTPDSRAHQPFFVNNSNQDRQKQLEKDNNRLMTSLDLLHEGAISALAEKQMQIETMQSSMQEKEDKDDARYLEEEMVEMRRQRVEMKEEIAQLEETLLQERESYRRLLQEKDRVIDELCCQVESRMIEIEKMQKAEEISNRKLRIIQDENTALFEELEREKIERIHWQAAGEKDSQSQQERERKPSREMQDSVIEEELAMVESSDDGQVPTQFHRSNSAQHMIEEIVRLRQSLRLSEQHHHHETAQLTSFFNKRISDVRDLYEKELESAPTKGHNNNEIVEQYEDRTSIRQTEVNPHALSQQLHQLQRLSDCGSTFGRQMSLIDRQSLYQADQNPLPFHSHLNFGKRVINQTPQSRTTSSRKLGLHATFHVPTVKKTDEQPQQDSRWGERIGTFLLGSLAGGSITYCLSRLSQSSS